MKTKTGKFIVIDGTDGSGKGTQTELLVSRLKSEGRDVVVLDFPQYGNPSAWFVEKYLRGEYGSADEVGPFRGSIFYALDRYDKSFEVRKWLEEGKVVVSNRYVSANMGHQAGKIRNRFKRWLFLRWLERLEYGIFGIPRPDKVVLLYVPPEVGQKLVDQKGERQYTQGRKRDLHEADLDHLKKAARAYKDVARRFGWHAIECTNDGTMLSREEIHEKLYSSISPLLS